MKFDFNLLRLIVFIDSSFVNNSDLIFQINYVIYLIDAINRINILHWLSVKYKRIIRNVLIFKLYKMAYEFDFETMLKTTIKWILQFNVSLMICIDFKSLYKYLIKLRTTQEKQLMINVMSFRQSYEKREIIKIKWIVENNNSTDVMTKTKAFSALKTVEKMKIYSGALCTE